MQSVMNLKIKFRESFRPFAPAVLEEPVADYFDFPSSRSSPYMLLVAAGSRIEADSGQRQGQKGLFGIDKLKLCRDPKFRPSHMLIFPARRPDGRCGSTRLLPVDQTLRCRKPAARSFINTSFNVPRRADRHARRSDAYRCFMATNIDVLVLERFVLREDQPQHAKVDSNAHLKQFSLD